MKVIPQWLGGAPKQCDIPTCKAAITDEFIDGATELGLWAIMCPKCHPTWGIGLGTGKGQRYRKQGKVFIKVGGKHYEA